MTNTDRRPARRVRSIVLLMLTTLIVCVPARAAFFTIHPDDPLPVAPGQTVNFELIVHPQTDGDFTIIGWDLDFSFDPGEMDTAMHAAAMPDADPATLQRPADVARRLADLLEAA